MLEDTLPLTPVSELGEFELIAKLTDGLQPKHADIVRGIGDDAAVISQPNGNSLVVTTDLLAEGVHFDLSYVPLRHLGYKAAIVNFSDVYAMNAKPLALTVSLAFSNRFTVEALEEFYAGLAQAAEEHDADIIGGDTSSSRTGLFISITALGQASSPNVVYRSGANVNDLICVSGDLGAAYAGLQLLEREKAVFKTNPNLQPDLTGFEYVLQRQLRPGGRKDVVELLAELSVLPTSMIDISDGLASELGHIAKAGKVGVRVYQDKLPIDYQTTQVADAFNIPATTFALYGGEDYELLFTISQADYAKLKNSDLVTVIGHVVDQSQGLNLVMADGSLTELTVRGFNHFKGNNK